MGTVVEICKHDSVKVEWDLGGMNIYRCLNSHTSNSIASPCKALRCAVLSLGTEVICSMKLFKKS